MCVLLFFFSLYGDLRDLHVLTHSFPTRRSSDLLGIGGYPKASHPGLLNALDRLPFEFRWSVRYEAMDHLQARGVFAALWRKHDDTSYDWRSVLLRAVGGFQALPHDPVDVLAAREETGRASCRERGGKAVV